MPLMRCTTGGKSGWKYGESGKCYPNPGGKTKAMKQMRAIKSSQGRKKSGNKDR